MEQTTRDAAAHDSFRLAVRDLEDAVNRFNQLQVLKTRLWMVLLSLLACMGVLAFYTLWKIERYGMVTSLINAI